MGVSAPIYACFQEAKLNLILNGLRIIGIVFAIFIIFIAFLQFQDGYTGYGLTSIFLGATSLFLVYRSIQKRKKL